MCRSNLTEGKWILLFQKFLFLYQKIPFFVLVNKNKTSGIPIHAFYFCHGMWCMLNAKAGRIIYTFIPC